MIEFILNSEHVITDLPSGGTLLDFIRGKKHLTGTKIGCREGDCGACTVLIGQHDKLKGMSYCTAASCLTPLGNIHHKHVVTIEGLNQPKGLSPIQSATIKNNATQCGFCTPGTIVSFTGYALNKNTRITGIMDAISGNICRCTGYNSIKKAGIEIETFLKETCSDNTISKLIEVGILPDYFNEIPQKLKSIKSPKTLNNDGYRIAGGTDILVSHHEVSEVRNVNLLNYATGNNIRLFNDECIIESGATASDLLHNKCLQKIFPQLVENFRLISSEQIRNMGTVGGNLVNASPIADLAIYLLALDTKLTLKDNSGSKREINLRDFYKAYKKTDLKETEIIENIKFKILKPLNFSFEKVSKRKHLDIASVNSAMSIELRRNIIKNIRISAGGVAPIPLFLKNTCDFLKDKQISNEIIRKAHCILKEEISPISDIRGSETYKRLLIRQLFYSHFIKLLPDQISLDKLIV